MTTVGQVLRRDDAHVVGDPAAGRLGSRVALPRGRAVVGGLLVALSALGLLLAHDAATRTHLTAWLVARRPIEAGSRIEVADLATARMQLPDATTRRLPHSERAVVGTVARIDLAAGDLIERSAVTSRQPATGPTRRLTVDLSPAQALDGSLQDGDRVDVIGTGDEAGTSSVIARRALVVSTHEPDGGLGSTDVVRVTLVVADEDTAQAVIDSALHGKVTLVAGGGDGG